MQRRRTITHIAAAAAVFATVLVFGSVGPVQAASITVTTTVDEDDIGPGCSLREAIVAANTDAAFGGCTAGSGDDVVTVAPFQIYTLSGAQLPVITTSVTITGNVTQIRAAANPNTAGHRIFEISTMGHLTLNSIGLTNGSCDNSSSCDTVYSPGDYRGYGGAVFNAGILDINTGIIWLNQSNGGDGGGIYSAAGTVNLTNTLLGSNAANGSGGALANRATSTMSVTDSTLGNATFFTLALTGNTSFGGGAISNQGTLTVTTSAFGGNSAVGPSGFGGAVLNSGAATITRTSLLDNEASRGGAVSAAYPSHTVIANSTLYTNRASVRGGAIDNRDELTLLNSTITANTAPQGAGLHTTAEDGWLDGSKVRVTRITNTIFDTGDDCFQHVVSAPASTMVGSNNVIATAGAEACTAGRLTSDPQLGTVSSDYFFPLLAGSPAIDGGDPTTCAAAPVSNLSQNGLIRPSGAACDIGSFEFSSPAPPAPAQRLANPGFDMYKGTSKVPTSWKAGRFSTKDGKSTRVKRSGKASVRVVRSARAKTLKQTVALTRAAGTRVSFSFYVAGKDLARSTCSVRVTLKGTTTTTKTLKCPTRKTYKFTKRAVSFTAPNAFTSITVVVTAKHKSGSIWIDQASLIV